MSDTVVLDKPKETKYEPQPKTMVGGGMSPPRKPPRTAINTGEDDDKRDEEAHDDDAWALLGIRNPFS